MHFSILSTLDPLVREITALSLSGSCSILTIGLEPDFTILDLESLHGEKVLRRVPLAHSCITSSMREAVLPLLEEWSDRLDDVLLVLPPAVESINIVPSFADMLADHPLLSGSRVSSVVTATDLTGVSESLLHHVSLQDRRLELFEQDDRCVGEVLAVNLGHADVLIALDHEPLALDLVEHLRPHDSILIHELADLDPDLLFARTHDADAGIARVHPVTTVAWGGPTDRGVWTLDLHSDRPFHPGRLAENLSLLSPDGVCIRGCFWLPSRPRFVCTWNSHGSSVSIGTAGDWEQDPMTHLIVTGVGDLRGQLAQTFGGTLVQPDEMRSILQWVGSDDGLDEWFVAD